MVKKAGLFLLLCVLAAGFWWGTNKDGDAVQSVASSHSDQAELLWPAFQSEIASLQKVEVLANQGKHRVTLVRHPEHGFVVQERDWPANMTDVRRLLHGLGQARVVGSRGSDPRYHAELGVADVATHPSSKAIRFYVDKGLLGGMIAGQPRGEDQQFVRLEHDATVRLIDQVFALVADPGAWLNTDLLVLPPDVIASVRLQAGAGEPLVVVKNIQADSDFSLQGVANKDLTDEQKKQVTALGYWLTKLSIRDVWTGKTSTLPVDKAATLTVDLVDGSRITATMYPLQGKRWVAFDVTLNDASDAAWLPVLQTFRTQTQGRLFELTGQRGEAFSLQAQ